MKRRPLFLLVPLALAAIGLALVARRGGGGGGEGSPADPRPVAVGRPGAVYAPKAEPVQRAERPALPGPVAVRDADGGRGESGDDADAGDSGEFPDIVVPPELRDNDPAIAALEPERAFSETVWEALAGTREELRADGARLLASENAEDRALGGVLLFFGEALDGEVLDFVAADPDPLVPLSVLDWVRDFGTDDQIDSVRRSLASRGMASDDLLAFAERSAGLVGGGRSALDLYLAGFGEGEVPAEGLARLVASPEASYDVREQALFKLLEPETRPTGEAALRAFADGFAEDDGGLLPFAARKLSDLALVSNPDGDDEKVWDAEAPVVFFLSQAEGGLQARDLANYLEYALRRDDPEFPPIVELGTWEFANDFLLSARDRPGDLPASAIDALDRIASSLDRLVEYDPAFNPFETVEDDGPGEDGDDGSGEDSAGEDDSDEDDPGEDGDDDFDEDADDDSDEDSADGDEPEEE